MNQPENRPSGPQAAKAADDTAKNDDAVMLADADALIELALREDIGTGDLTSAACLSESATASAEVVARCQCVASGTWLVQHIYRRIDPRVSVKLNCDDGRSVGAGQSMATVSGPARAVLTGERTVLNFLQRLTGIATLTARYVDQVRGTGTAIVDTRKTTPGWRRLEKYAVRCGGGVNHRFGLYDELLIKDNHLALAEGDIANFIAAARAKVGPDVVIEVEVDTLEQFEQVLMLPVDMILLDNMSPVMMAEARAIRDDRRHDGRPLLEASGGVQLDAVRAIAESGVDRISVGALTHSAPAADIGMDIAVRRA